MFKKFISIMAMLLIAISIYKPTVIKAEEVPETYSIDSVDYQMIFSQDEINVLEKCVMAEAGNQDQKTQEMVAAVILNRVKSADYPNSISEVVFQKDGETYQFSCISDGNYDAAVSTEQVNAAVDQALFDYVNDMRIYPDNVLYFNSNGYFSWAAPYMQSGSMYFSTK